MKKTLLLGIGAAVGWTLGARAGRPAYDRAVQRWSHLAESVGLGQLAATVKEAGIDVRDSAVNRVSTAVSTSADGVADRIDPTMPPMPPSHLGGETLRTGQVPGTSLMEPSVPGPV